MLKAYQRAFHLVEMLNKGEQPPPPQKLGWNKDLAQNH